MKKKSKRGAPKKPPNVPAPIRELRNAIERAMILASEPLADLVAPLQSALQVGGDVTLEALEAEHIRRVLFTALTLEEAANVLGIDLSTLYRKRKRYGL
jgi:NtrC-family two-component system response regulator AlgB